MMMNFNPSGTAIDMSGLPQHHQDEGDNRDIASVSTETEDDPVNMAMRASLGTDQMSDEGEDGVFSDEDEDEEEQIVWTGTK